MRSSARIRHTRAQRSPQVAPRAAAPRTTVADLLPIAESIFEHVFDISLWISVYFANYATATNSFRAGFESARAADDTLASLNYHALKQGLTSASRKNLIKKRTNHRAWPEITAAGRARLNSLIPRYDEKRTWDKHVYLITYDVAEKKRRQRDKLRQYLKGLACGLLQDSVWITTYDPSQLLRSFVDSQGLSASVLISQLGKEGFIGTQQLPELLSQVYRLKALNSEYETVLAQVHHNKPTTNMHVFAYLSILSRDPQLPFELLPDWWRGGQAYAHFKQHLTPLYRRLDAHSTQKS